MLALHTPSKLPVLKDTLRKLVELALAHAAAFAFPLVFAIVCGRALGIHDYGIVAFYTSLAGFLGFVIEFGFDWLGVREVGQNQNDKAHTQSVLWNVTAAKLLIWLVVFFVVGIALLVLRQPGEIVLMLGAMAYLFGFAWDASWYLRAFERTRLLMVINAVVRLGGVVVVLLAVRSPGDLGAAMWCYSAVALSSSALTWLSLRREGWVHGPQISLSRIFSLYRGAWAIVVGNLSSATLTNGGVALLGMLADPATVGAANLALRLRMAGQAVMLPIQQLGYVRVSGRAKSNPKQAVRVGRMVLAVMMGMSVVAALVLMFGASAITQAVFREPQPVAIGMIMLLGLSIPINSAANLFGMQCLIAFGFERAYAVVITLAALIFCGSLFLMASSPFAYGWAVIVAELVALVACGLALRRGLRPLGAA